MFQASPQYSPIGGVDDDEAKLLHDGAEGFPAAPRPNSRFLRLLPWLSHGVLICASMVFFTLWMLAPSPDALVLYSPANEAIESIGIIRFNGSLGAPSIYRGSPSPEVDAAWERVSHDSRPTRMTLEQLLRTGEEPLPFMAKYPDEYGGGYIATVEVIHQLHCLNMLRKVTWGEHYKHSDHSFDDTPEAFRTHVDHCIEMIRQNIMCRGDVTMITYDWVKGSKDPFPNFNVRHQCRNFDKVLDWVDAHRVFIPKSKFVRLEDSVDLPSPP
ncbi:hypothetical protein BV22DRAFT_1041177 [Leucogyrophana mollusca]|uniref:Uncharacterized protein n=1 Tax=Leucogyrophana mollusca TaxID=85980 RepID=A0ACB8B0R0_9AGAM|nr:hypothetical protein BV22DRAFT_1041177 [Leucogyrophana mollusca]